MKNEPDMRECKRIIYDSTTLKDAIHHVLVIFLKDRSFSLSQPRRILIKRTFREKLEFPTLPKLR